MKINKKAKFLIKFSTAAIFISLVIIFSLSIHRQKNTAAPTNVSVTPPPLITTSLSQPNNFIWKIDHLEFPSQVELISTSSNTQAKSILKNLASKLGFNSQPSVIPNSPIIFYSNPQESTNLYLNTNENTIKYDLNLLTKHLPKNTQNIPTITLLQEVLNLPETLSLTKTSTHYQTTNGPRFINSSKNKATYIATSYNYQYNHLPILFTQGNSIETIHSLSGKLVKLTLNLPPQINSTSNTAPVKTISQIKTTPASQFITITLSGNKQFSLSNQEIDIDTAVINNGFLGYLYDSNSNTLSPYIFLTGVTEDPQYGAIELLIATPANTQ